MGFPKSVWFKPSVVLAGTTRVIWAGISCINDGFQNNQTFPNPATNDRNWVGSSHACGVRKGTAD